MIDDFPTTTITLKVGEQEKLRCKSSGEPDAETIWFKGNERINFDSNNKYIQTNDKQDLIFVNPQTGESDPTGKYTCHVKNKYGTTELGYFLSVSLACEFFFFFFFTF